MRPCALPFVFLLSLVPASAAEPERFAPDRPIDVERIDLDLDLDLKTKTIAGSATLTLRALRDVRSVTLDAVDLRISEVKLVRREGQAALRFDHDGKHLRFDLGLAQGQRARVRVAYKAVKPQEGLYFFGPTKDAPKVPYQVWSQGETVTSRYWFPCVDHPDERQATSLRVRVAEGLTVVSNGKPGKRIAGEGKHKGKVTWSFRQDREHVAYLVTLVVGTFDVVSETPWRGKVPITHYVPPGRKGDAARSFARTKDMLDFFSAKTGVDYPWAKYEQVVVEQFSFGGMENTGATTLNERTLHDARAHLDYSSEGLVAHELAHQWYGDLLTCRDWAHVWLNESFATYFDALWTEHSRGVEDYAYELFGNSEGGMRGGKRRPILDRRYPTPDSMFDGRVYPKGSCVLHMLRRQLGERAFWEGIQRYTRTHKDSGVETSDLRRALERASGRGLERFFRQWLERPGHPKIEVWLKRDAERGLLTVTIDQKQKGEAYRFPAELSFRFGEREVRHVLPVKSKRERFVLAERAAPTYFRFDPREAVILKELTVHKGRNLWIAQLSTGDTVGRIRAARHLGKDKRPISREALLLALKAETFWGVRAEVAEVVGGLGGEAAGKALLAALGREKHPKVRRAVVEALGQRGRDPAAAKALASLLTKGDASYYVEAAAVRAYGKATPDARALLEGQLRKPSHNEVIREAAIQALRGLDDPRLVSLFQVYLAPATPPRLRGRAVRALSVAALPGALDADIARALSALGPILRSPSQRLRRAALDVAKALGERGRPLLSEVERLAKIDLEPKIREAAQKTAEAIRSGAKPNAQLAELRKRARKLEESKGALEKRVKTLEERIDALRKKTQTKKPKKPRKPKKLAPKRKKSR
jgi:aminopeptidase N